MSDVLQVNQQWLKWIRTSLHYSEEQVGKKLRIKPDRVREWEKTGEISYDKLKKISELYGVGSLIFFNDDAPPKEIDNVPDFRTQKNINTDKTPELYKIIRDSKNKRQTILNYMEDLEIQPIDFKTTTENKSNLINYLNEYLDISKSKIQSFKINEWITELENKGILIFQFYNIPISEARGFAFSFDKLPIIGINYQDSPKAKIFTLFHELTHLLIGKDGISGEYHDEPTEILCNQVTAEILLPQNSIEDILNDKLDYTSKLKLQLISAQFPNISKEAIIYRLSNLNFITNKERDNELKLLHGDKKEKKKKRKKYNKVSDDIKFKQIASKNLNQNGHVFTNILIKAYNEDLISDITLSEELMIPRNVIPYLMDKLEDDTK